jgi:excinuclease UvrABC helicase subunit UvrB
MEDKVKKLIKKLEAENSDRYDELKNSDIDDRRKRIHHTYNYTLEIIQQLKNCFYYGLKK